MINYISEQMGPMTCHICGKEYMAYYDDPQYYTCPDCFDEECGKDDDDEWD